MARVEIEFILKGGEKIRTDNEELIKQLFFQNEAYIEIEGSIKDVVYETEVMRDVTTTANEEVNSSYQTIIQTYRENVKELQALAGQGDFTSERYKELSRSVAEFKANLEESQRQINAQKSAMDLSLGTLGGLTGGFSAARGAMALMGVQSEDLQKALLQVQGAFALSQGIKQVQEAQSSFAALAKMIRVNVVGAFTTLKGAIIATGIGALIVGLGLLVANWDKVKDVLGLTRTAQDDMNDSWKEAVAASTNVQKEVIKVGLAFDQANKGIITQDEALKVYNETLGLTLGATQDYNTAENNFIQKTDAYIRATQLRAQADILIQKLAVLATEDLNDKIEDQVGLWGRVRVAFLSAIGDYSGSANLAADLLAQANEQVVINIENQQNQLRESLSTIFEEIKQLSQDNNLNFNNNQKDLTSKLKEEEAKRLAAIKTNQDRRIALLDEGLRKELEIIKARYEEELELAKKNGEDINLLTQLYDKDRLNLLNNYTSSYIDITRQLFSELNALTTGSVNFQLNEIRRQQLETIKLRRDELNNITSAILFDIGFDDTQNTQLNQRINQFKDLIDKQTTQNRELEEAIRKRQQLERSDLPDINFQSVINRQINVINKLQESLNLLETDINQSIINLAENYGEGIGDIIIKVSKAQRDLNNEIAAREAINQIELANIRIQAEIEGLKVLNSSRKELNKENIGEIIKQYRQEFKLITEEQERAMRRLAEIEMGGIDGLLLRQTVFDNFMGQLQLLQNEAKAIRIGGQDGWELDVQRLKNEGEELEKESIRIGEAIRKSLEAGFKIDNIEQTKEILIDLKSEIDTFEIISSVRILSDDEQDQFDKLKENYGNLSVVVEAFNIIIEDNTNARINQSRELSEEIRKRTEEEIRNNILLNNMNVMFNKQKISTDIEYYSKVNQLYIDNVDDYDNFLKEKEIFDLQYKQDELFRQILLVNNKQSLYKKDSEEFKKFELEKLKLREQLADTSIKLEEKVAEANKSSVQKQLDALNEFISKYEQVFNQFLDTLNEVGNAINAILDFSAAKQNKISDDLVEKNNERRDNEINNYTLTTNERENITRRYALKETEIEEERAAKIKEIEKQRAEVNFAIAIANIIANGSIAFIRAIAELGPIAGPIVAGLISAQTAAQVVTVTNERNIVTQLERGGLLEGPTHKEGGIRLTPEVEVEGGEAVINKVSTKKYLPLLSAINVDGGGVPLTSQVYKPQLLQTFNLGGMMPLPQQQTVGKDSIPIKQEPIRAYLMDADVRNNKIKNDRITRKSRFLR